MRSVPVSAGLLVYRRTRPGLEVLIGHPGGPYWRRKDHGAWTIPKGLVEGTDEPLPTALREFGEETGLPVPPPPYVPLGAVRQSSGKVVHAFCCEADLDLVAFCSNPFRMEWPPRSGRMAEFPELDRLTYFPLEQATEKLLAYQRPLLTALAAAVFSTGSGAPGSQPHAADMGDPWG